MVDPRYTKSAREGGIPRPQTFGEAFNEAKADKKSVFEYPPGSGKMYTTETREERTQKAYSDTSRRQEGEAAKASNRPGRVRPDETAVSSMGLRDIPGLIARGMSEGADRVPAGRGLGAAFTAAGAARGAGAAAQGALARREAASAAAGAERLASRVEPRMRRSGESVEESVKQARAEMAREPRMRRSGESVEESAKQARAEMAREPRMRRSGESVDESVSQARAEMAREPRMRRSGESVEEAMKQARMDMAREPRLEPARALSAAERKPPAVQGDKASMTPRSRTRETDEGVEFKKGGKVKAYAKGGSVRGAGIAQRGLRKCKVY